MSTLKKLNEEAKKPSKLERNVNSYERYAKNARRESKNAQKYQTPDSHKYALEAHLHAAKFAPDFNTAQEHISHALSHI